MHEVIFKKGSVVEFDLETYQGVLRGERIVWQVNVGDPILEGSSAAQAINTGKMERKQGPANDER